MNLKVTSKELNPFHVPHPLSQQMHIGQTVYSFVLAQKEHVLSSEPHLSNSTRYQSSLITLALMLMKKSFEENVDF